MNASGSGTPTTPAAMSADVQAQFAALGAPVADMQRHLQAQAPARRAGGDQAGQPLARHLWPVVQLAMAMQTQVRAVAVPAGLLYLGLDYAALPPVQRALGLPQRGLKAERLLRHLRVCEAVIVQALNCVRTGAVA